jgi:hypothetical protein
MYNLMQLPILMRFQGKYYKVCNPNFRKYLCSACIGRFINYVRYFYGHNYNIYLFLVSGGGDYP